MVVIESI